MSIACFDWADDSSDCRPFNRRWCEGAAQGTGPAILAGRALNRLRREVDGISLARVAACILRNSDAIARLWDELGRSQGHPVILRLPILLLVIRFHSAEWKLSGSHFWDFTAPTWRYR